MEGDSRTIGDDNDCDDDPMRRLKITNDVDATQVRMMRATARRLATQPTPEPQASSTERIWGTPPKLKRARPGPGRAHRRAEHRQASAQGGHRRRHVRRRGHVAWAVAGPWQRGKRRGRMQLRRKAGRPTHRGHMTPWARTCVGFLCGPLPACLRAFSRNAWSQHVSHLNLSRGSKA